MLQHHRSATKKKTKRYFTRRSKGSKPQTRSKESSSSATDQMSFLPCPLSYKPKHSISVTSKSIFEKVVIVLGEDPEDENGNM